MSMKTRQIFTYCSLIPYVCAFLFANFAHNHSTDFRCLEEATFCGHAVESPCCSDHHPSSASPSEEKPTAYNSAIPSNQSVQGYCIACCFQANSKAVLFYQSPGLQDLSYYNGSPLTQVSPCCANHSYLLPIRGPPVA